MWTRKCQFRSFICVTIHFHIFEFNSIIILNMILSFCPFYFHESFFYFPWSMAPKKKMQVYLSNSKIIWKKSTSKMVPLIKEIKKRFIEIKWTERKYHVQDNATVELKDLRMYCNTNKLPELSFSSSHSKLEQEGWVNIII